MGEGDAEVEAPAFMPGEDVHRQHGLSHYRELTEHSGMETLV